MDSCIFINRLMIYPNLGKCNVVFRHGLNVVWSRDVADPTIEANLRNSVGKTTFVKFIDYLLGKTHFIVTLDDQKRELFEDRYLLSEVIFGQDKFTVKRSVLDIDKIEVFDGWVINDLLSKKLTAKGNSLDLKGYIALLTAKIYGDNIVVNNKNYISHRSLMSFLIRDQVYGFVNYNSGIKEETAKARKKRLEFLLGLISQAREELERDINELEKDKGELAKKKSILKNYFELVTEKPLKDLRKQKSENEKIIKNLQDELTKRNNLLTELESQNEECKSAEIELNRKAAKIDEEVYILDLKQKDYQMAMKDIDNELYNIKNIDLAINIFNPFQFNRCPVYLKELNSQMGVCDFIVENENKDEFHDMISARKKILLFERKDLKRAINKVKAYIKDLTNEKSKVLKAIKKNKELQTTIHSEKEEKFTKVLQRLKELEHQNVLIEKELSHFKYVSDLNGDIKDKNERIKEKKTALADLVENRASDFNITYNKIVNYLTNNTRIGKINTNDYKPAIYYPNGTLDKGSAMGNVAVIAFDLALLEMSLQFKEVSSVYPKFLVHDSPKLHDIQLEMYNRIMDYVAIIEEEYKKQNKRFQYIITTLDISNIVDKDRETYIRLTLDNSGDGGKLFGCQVAID